MNQREVTAEIMRLHGQGMTDEQIAADLDTRGIRGIRNAVLSESAVYQRRMGVFEKQQKAEQVLSDTPPSDVSEPSDTTDQHTMSDTLETSDASQVSDVSELPEVSEPSEVLEASNESPMSEPLEPSDTPPTSDASTVSESPVILSPAILDAIREEVSKAMQSILKSQTFQTQPTRQAIEGPELCPMPGKVLSDASKRKLYQASRAKIGGVVDSVLVRELQRWCSDHGVNLSRGIETALWSFLGKPKLSFEPGDLEVETTEPTFSAPLTPEDGFKDSELYHMPTLRHGIKQGLYYAQRLMERGTNVNSALAKGSEDAISHYRSFSPQAIPKRKRREKVIDDWRALGLWPALGLDEDELIRSVEDILKRLHR